MSLGGKEKQQWAVMVKTKRKHFLLLLKYAFFFTIQNGAEPGVMGFVGPNEGDETSQYAAIAEGYNIPYVSNSETSLVYSDKVRKNLSLRRKFF